MLYDQHDREWTAQVSLKSGMPTGLIEPSFRAPWYPDHQYLRVNPDNTSELFIDYDAMLRNRNARLEEYHKTAVDAARQRRLPLPERGNYSDELKSYLGKPPKAIEPIVAAMQKNVYILGEDYAEAKGLRYRVDSRLEPFVTVPTATEELLSEFDFSDESDAPRTPHTFRPASTPAEAPIDDTAEETEETEPEEELDLAGFNESTDDELDATLQDLEEEVDGEALGGRTVAPRNADRAARQAPRRGKSSAVRNRHGRNRSQPAKRPTMADGVSPVIADGGL